MNKINGGTKEGERVAKKNLGYFRPRQTVLEESRGGEEEAVGRDESRKVYYEPVGLRKSIEARWWSTGRRHFFHFLNGNLARPT